MNLQDDELQRKIEAGEPIADANDDARAYRKLFDALNAEPSFELPINFADNVIRKIEVKDDKKYSRDLIWLGVGSLFLVVLLIAALAMIAPFLTLGFLKDISGFAGVFAFAAIFLIVLHLIDKRVVHPPHPL